MNKLKEWLMRLFKKEAKSRIKLDLKMNPKPNIQRVFLDNYSQLKEHGWYIVRLDDTDGKWEVITGPER
jgi:hypothetical protein